MSRKRMLVALCLCALALVSTGWVREGQSARPSQEASATQEQAPEVPDHIAYLQLFRQIAAFKKKAAALEREGQDNSALKTYFKRRAELDDVAARMLDEIASGCHRELQQLDAKAKALTDVFKARYPGGRVPHGELPQPPPAELRALSEERDAIVLRCRDLLRASLSDETFSRLHDFVKRRDVSGIKPPQVEQLPSASRPDGQ